MIRKVPLPLALLGGLVLLGANTAFGWPYAIRFTYTPLNNWGVALLALSMPVSLFFVRAYVMNRLWRAAALVSAVVLSVPAFSFAVLAVLDGQSDKWLDSLAIGLVSYRIYMRDPGAATSQPFTFLRKELDTHLGFKLVRTIWAADVHGAAPGQSHLYVINVAKSPKLPKFYATVGSSDAQGNTSQAGSYARSPVKVPFLPKICANFA